MSPEEAGQYLLENHRTSLVVCVDETGGVHFDFRGQTQEDADLPTLLMLVARQVAMAESLLVETGMREKEFWETMESSAEWFRQKAKKKY